MGFLDKAKQAAEQAASKAKEGVQDVQTKRSLGQAYTELGEETFRLIESGAVSNPQLEAHAEKIRALQVEEAEPAMAGAAASTGATATSSTEPPASNQPPAMPT
jgi:hypothetical protein